MKSCNNYKYIVILTLTILFAAINSYSMPATPEKAGLKRYDFELLGVRTRAEQNKMLRDFAPTIYKIGAINEVPAVIPAWGDQHPASLLRSKDVKFAKTNNLIIHTSLHMYHRQANYPDSAAKIDIEGRIISDSYWTAGHERPEGGSWIMCVGHSEFQKAFVRNMKKAIDLGSTVFEVQDTARKYYSCFCDICVIGFRDLLLRDARMARFKKTILEMGIDLNQFNIRLYALEHTSGTSGDREQQFNWGLNNVVSKAWRKYKLLQLRDFLNDVISLGKSYGASKGKNITFLIHIHYLQKRHLDLVDLFDGIWAETPLDEYSLAADPLVPKASIGIYYYPPSGIMGASASVLGGINGGMLSMWMPWGTPVPELAFKKGKASSLYQLLLAETYASGGIAGIIFGLNKGAFENRVATINKIKSLKRDYFDPEIDLPARWYVPDGVGGFSWFLRKHPELFEENTLMSEVLLLKTRNAYNMGSKHGENIFGWAELLSDAHIPYKVFLDGNGEFMTIKLTQSILHNYGRVIALGTPDKYSEEHFAILKNWLLVKNHVLYVQCDLSAWITELNLNKTFNKNIIQVEDMGTEYQRTRRADVWLQKAMQTFGSALKTTLNNNCLVRLYKKETAKHEIWTLHLVNRNYSWFDDKIIPRFNVKVDIDSEFFGSPDQLSIQTYNLNGDLTNQAMYFIKEDSIQIKLPKLNLYTVVELEKNRKSVTK